MLGSAVEQHVRRRFALVSEVYWQGVALARPNPAAIRVVDEALLVVLPDDRPEIRFRERKAMGTASLEQLGNRCPTAGVEPEPDPFGLMSQD
jgi:hypothetical protein